MSNYSPPPPPAHSALKSVERSEIPNPRDTPHSALPTVAPPPACAPCTPHPSLVPCARQLDHWLETETLLYHQVQGLLRPKAAPAPAKTDPSPETAPQPPTSPQPPPPPPRISDFGFPSDFGLRVSDFHPGTLNLVNHILKPVIDCQKLLLKHAQLALACQKLQNKAAHAPETKATGTKPDGDNSAAIALMRKAFFADVDELEKSGEIVLPD